MTSQQRREAARYLQAFDFSGLFTEPSIGWDWPATGQRIIVPTAEGGSIDLEVVAEKKGVKVLLVPPNSDGAIMPSDQRKRLESAVTPLAAEHLLIFADRSKTRQVWLWTSRLPGKPVRHRELTWERGCSNELILQKLTTIAFTLDEEEALDITGVVKRLRDNLDRDRLTKRFYDEFKRHKDAFQSFIEGLKDSGIAAHYTSLMLNRLMFCYFLQQKGFLDGDQHYLRNRLETVRATLGTDQFHSFYRTFLKRLFHEGLDSQDRPAELTKIIGKNIPYLNGGIFAEHNIERDHPDIQVPDAAFEKIFAFFDKYQWHLDDRPLAEGNEINPEVLGYVFEKDTNQKEMGAYYTKEDITEYICKNTILPFLLQQVATKLPAQSWDLLKTDPDRYIYEPVRRGAGENESAWINSLPQNIAIGLDTEAPDLLGRRKDWNTSTPASHALPTEIWRETIARHQRCHDLRKKLRAGDVKEPAELVTLNLNIRQFVQDVIATAPADLALALWNALASLTVLDPTCGSGAFLFAALEIIEPLYEGLLERLRALLSDWGASGEKHPIWEREFRRILDAVDRHPNEAYFIHKTSILHNLYGVDIMEEAVEICKLRLFLKLAAQLEPGQPVEPLPDIDFNIRAGNTLVGYASRDEIRRAFSEASGSGQMALQGIETSLDDFRRIMEDAEDADRLFCQFQTQQDLGTETAMDQLVAKRALERKFDALRLQLDRFLAGQYDLRNCKTESAFEQWRASHAPFHWFVEFYGIMDRGGFDVIVGNPPYVEIKVLKQYSILGYKCEGCGNLYALVLERCFALGAKCSRQGYIVPVSSASTERYAAVQKMLLGRALDFSSYDDRPARLFDGLEHIRLTILLIGAATAEPQICSTRYNKWLSEERATLFSGVFHVATQPTIVDGTLPKLCAPLEASLISKVAAQPYSLSRQYSRSGRHSVFYSRKVGYFLQVLNFQPRVLDGRGTPRPPSEFKELIFENKDYAALVLCCLNSSLFYWFVTVFSDCRHLNKREIDAFRICLESLAIGPTKDRLIGLANALMSSLENNSLVRHMRFKHDQLTVQCIYPKNSKAIIDEIDSALAEHYGFTQEELDFVINYDIKYRMGLSGGAAENSGD